MNMRILAYASLILLGTFISSVAQVMLKKAALREYSSRVREYLNPLVISAYAVFLGASFLSIYAYKAVPLSMGPILEASSYIYITIFGVMIFKETLSREKAAALILILAGTAVYALG